MASIDRTTSRATIAAASSSAQIFGTIQRQTFGEQLATATVSLADDCRDLASLPRLTWARRQFIHDDWVHKTKPRSSDAHRHGYVLRELVDGQLKATVWACKICDDSRSVKLYDITNATSAVWSHLTRHHNIVKDGKQAREVEPGQTSLVDTRPAKARLFVKSYADRIQRLLLQ